MAPSPLFITTGYAQPIADGVAYFLLSIISFALGPGTVSVMIFGKSVLNIFFSSSYMTAYAGITAEDFFSSLIMYKSMAWNTGISKTPSAHKIHPFMCCQHISLLFFHPEKDIIHIFKLLSCAGNLRNGCIISSRP